MPTSDLIPLFFVTEDHIQAQRNSYGPWLEVSGFTGAADTFCMLPAADGSIEKVLVGRPDVLNTWTLGSLSQSLPPYLYSLGDQLSDEDATKVCLGWQLGQYRFGKYKQNGQKPLPQLEFPSNADRAYIDAATTATTLVRDLVNTPANDMGPGQLEAAARTLAETHQADFQVTVGDDLTTQNYPMIYAVGKANVQPPRLIDLHWGAPAAPRVTLVGKGVCFDTGGLDIKSAANMKLMKKDMGGAAQVLGLASMIMALDLPVYLRVLIPAVENSISSNAMRPYDVLPSRKGITVEVGNTDAEGRLVLADALWEASDDHPQLLIDCATLTGAARVALGTELPAFFCNRSDIAARLKQVGQQADDPFWELPLHVPYRNMLESSIADINNISNGSYGGAITAALFLQEFVDSTIPWIHVDFMAWNLRGLPGRPEGGDAMGMRALFELIRSSLQEPAA